MITWSAALPMCENWFQVGTVSAFWAGANGSFYIIRYYILLYIMTPFRKKQKYFFEIFKRKARNAFQAPGWPSVARTNH